MLGLGPDAISSTRLGQSGGPFSGPEQFHININGQQHAAGLLASMMAKQPEYQVRNYLGLPQGPDAPTGLRPRYQDSGSRAKIYNTPEVAATHAIPGYQSAQPSPYGGGGQQQQQQYSIGPQPPAFGNFGGYGGFGGGYGGGFGGYGGGFGGGGQNWLGGGNMGGLGQLLALLGGYGGGMGGSPYSRGSVFGGGYGGYSPGRGYLSNLLYPRYF
jgi:hypothetical protein